MRILKKLFGTRGFVTALGVALIVALAVVAYLVVFDPMKKTIAYCAILPDSIGLYPGNNVTVRGVPVGSVTAVVPENGGVRVAFDLDADRVLHGDVVATTVSATLVADRELEVLGDPAADRAWDPHTCVTKTFTPKSITETLQAFSNLANELTGEGNPTDQNHVRDSIEAFQQATSGTGTRLNQLIHDLGAALRRPDAAIGHLGNLIDAFAALAQSAALNWPDIKTMLLQAAPGITLVNDVWGYTVQIIDSLLAIFPMFNDIARKYGRDILAGLDEIVPYLRLLSADLATLQKIIEMIPAIVEAFQQSIDPQTGAVELSYAAPKVALQPDIAEQVCTAVNAATPGRCRNPAGGLASVDLAPLIFGLAGAR
ncbi:MlaD family protein [Nocardia brasiliensis]